MSLQGLVPLFGVEEGSGFAEGVHMVAFCAASIGGGRGSCQIKASVQAGVHWRASPEGVCPCGDLAWSGLDLKCLGPGVLALGPG